MDVRWHGRGGQGAFTASKILGAAAILDGWEALSFPSFGPERRGAPVLAYTKIRKERVSDRSIIARPDFIVCLDETLYRESFLEELSREGKVFLNTKNPGNYEGQEKVAAVDADAVSRRVIGRPVSNTAMLAYLAALTGLVRVASLQEAAAGFLPQRVVEKNIQIINEMVKVAEEYEKTQAGIL